MSQHSFFARVFAISYKQSLLALVSMAAFAVGVLVAPQASAQLTVGGGGTCTRSSLCPSLTFPTKPKRCSSPSPGSCASCDTACPASTLGATSVFELYTGGQLPVDDPATPLDESAVFGDKLPGGPSFALKCSQGTAGTECPLGVPVVQSTQELTVRKGAQSTITLTQALSADWPAPPFKVQLAGTSFNDGVYPVIAVDFSRLVLTLGESARRNETKLATIALGNIKLEFTDLAGVLGAGKVYFRHADDSVSPPRCLHPTSDPNVCEDGVASASGFFNAEIRCTSIGTNLMLPCFVQASAGDGQFATFLSIDGENNFNACAPGQNCQISWSDAFKGNCKKDYPETSDFLACQTLKLTFTNDQSISNFLHRARNTFMAPVGTPLSFAFSTGTNAPGGLPVDITTSPDPVNAAEGGTITVKVLNNGAANLSLIDLSSVALTFANYVTGGGFSSVPNDQAPEQCGDGNCWNFKFNRAAVFNAYLAVHPELNCVIPDGTSLPINLVGAFQATGGEIAGRDSVAVKGTFTGTCN